MNLSKIHRIIYPVVCILLVAETIYLGVLYARNQKSDAAQQVAGAEIVVDSNLVKGLSKGQQKIDRKRGQGVDSNVIAQAAGLAKKLSTAISNDLPRTAHQIRVEKILDQIDELLSDDNEVKAVELARLVMADPDPEIRSEAVGVFAWAGVKALPELSKMLSDSDSDVAEEASDAWENALEDISDDATKALLLAAGIKTMNDEDSAESAIMLYGSMDDITAVPGIVDVIQSGTPVAAKVARDYYEFTTGEEYTPDAYEKWFKNEMAENAADVAENAAEMAKGAASAAKNVEQNLPEQTPIKEP